jgi:dUTP pyrophosphatase
MEKETLLKYIEELREIESKINADGLDLSFVSEIDEMMSKLTTRDGGMVVGIKKIHPNAIIPSYAKNGDAGMDLVITSVKSEDETQITYGFGISMEIPTGYVGLLFSRSSVKNFPLVMSNCVGVIDSGYRGEIMTTFKKLEIENNTVYGVGDRGAQILIFPYPLIKFVEKEDLSESERGEGGFGSTGS